MSPSPTEILIVNQHGDNRGDEAALLAMLAGFAECLGEVRFSLVHQFRDPNLPIDYGPHSVESHSMRLSVGEYLGLAAYTACRRLGLKPRLLLSRAARSIIEAYERADLVVSAPGGPYFGDIYRDHELAHWLFVILGRFHKVPTFLYATSAGPFKTFGLNTLRRRFYRYFDDLCVREDRSAANLKELLGLDVEVTADSALQRVVAPFEREAYFEGDRRPLKDKFLVSLTALQHKFPAHLDGPEHQRRYEEALLAGIEHLNGRRDCHYLILPQLYGAAKTDVPYLTALAERFPEGTSWELVDPDLDSDAHRAVVGMCDFSIACRYHPQIFAGGGATPGVCVYYEHKARSYMESLGLGRLGLDISKIDAESLIRAIDDALEHSEEIRAQIREAMVGIRKRAQRTTEKACILVQ